MIPSKSENWMDVRGGIIFWLQEKVGTWIQLGFECFSNKNAKISKEMCQEKQMSSTEDCYTGEQTLTIELNGGIILWDLVETR